MSSRIGAERLAGALLVAALASTSVAARAQGPSPEDAALAQSLFDEARHLMLADRFAEACPKLADSERLDPALGTLLNLAVCNEHVGKTASAWAEYRDAESIAKREGRAERVAYAHGHAAQLEPRLSHLVIVGAEGVSTRGLEVLVDGVAVGEAALGDVIPVDPGPHRIEASAARKRRWSLDVVVGDHAEDRRVVLPALEDAPVPAPAPPPVLDQALPGGPTAVVPAPPAPSPGEPHASARPSRAAFYVVGTAGMASLAFGAVAGMQAIVRWNDRTRLCSGDTCPPTGLDADGSARSWALAADVGLGVGAVAVAAAAYLFWASSSTEAPRSAVHVRFTPTVSSKGGGLDVGAAW
ncbi:MAG TPA: hypothetical protein VHS09_06840 [Polyangiaceae bacterium]|nr:hypothetical protein [Polyangiaceae bacterium]